MFVTQEKKTEIPLNFGYVKFVTDVSFGLERKV